MFSSSTEKLNELFVSGMESYYDSVNPFGIEQLDNHSLQLFEEEGYKSQAESMNVKEASREILSNLNISLANSAEKLKIPLEIDSFDYYYEVVPETSKVLFGFESLSELNTKWELSPNRSFIIKKKKI
jgi:hypothetical protein